MSRAHMSGINHDTQLARASVHNRGSRVADVPIYDGRGLAIGGGSIPCSVGWCMTCIGRM